MDWLLHIWNNLPPEWQAILKWVFDKHLGDTIKIFVFLATLPFWKRIWDWLVRQRSAKILEDKLAPDYTEQQIKAGIKYYIWPDCQNADPTQLDEIRQSEANRADLYKKINNLLHKESKYKHFILLADTGMGKTSFLLNYFVRHLRKWHKRYEMKLIPLGVPGLEDKLKNIEKPEKTILLLDAFDEDAAAIKDHVQQLNNIVNWTQNFRKIIITCRTQFFPRDQELPLDTELLKSGPRGLGESWSYTFYKLYLSPFDEKQVKAYLRRRFPLWRLNCRWSARKIVNKVKDLVARPLLLAYIDDLIRSKKNFENAYQIYEVMIDAWLERERKYVRDKAALLNFSKQLAGELFLNREERKSERIPYEQLEPLARKFEIKLETWQLAGRSLLNRDADGNYKFAHRSILEFLFAQQVIEQTLFKTTRHLWTDQIKKFIIDKLGENAYPYIYYLSEFITFPSQITKLTKSFIKVTHYQLAIYPVTNLQYELFDPKHERCKYSDQDDQPVVNVSWEDAMNYCKWLSQQTGKTYRLPTETEWEFAASGGGKRKYPWGNEEPTPDRANYDIYIGKTTPVGSYPAGKTPEGLFDMAGNVWEWCQDWYDEKQDARVLRGGCFGYYYLDDLRVSSRDGVYPLVRSNYRGFRVVCVA